MTMGILLRAVAVAAIVSFTMPVLAQLVPRVPSPVPYVPAARSLHASSRALHAWAAAQSGDYDCRAAGHAERAGRSLSSGM